jgi:hypothetical protein
MGDSLTAAQLLSHEENMQPVLNRVLTHSLEETIISK